MAPIFHTTKVVVNITVLITTTERMIRNTSHPTGNSKVNPFFGIPLLLSSNKFVGASGRPVLFFPVILSFSLRASNTLLPSSAFTTGFGSELRLRTLAALNFSLAVNLDRFGITLISVLFVSCIGSEAEMDPLEGSVSGFSVVSEVLMLVSVARRSLFETKRDFPFLELIGLLKRSVVEGDEKWVDFRIEAPIHTLGTF